MASPKAPQSPPASEDIAAYLDMPPERRAAAKAHAALLSRTAGRIALELPFGADVDDFRRVLTQGGQAMTDLAALSARGLAKAIRDKQVSSVEATKAAIERLQACHELTNCIIALEADEALAAAKAADAAIAKGSAKGPLAGVPLAHKDMFDRKGKIASWGAKIRADKPAAADATAIARFKASGALQIAALHLAEFAYGPTGHNYVLGHARNPWDPTRITGGSSAGTAAAVAYGAIPAGLGSDTGGSLRLPAACCGIASIKPTWGRISRAGAMPLAPALDTVGVIARHVEDLALTLGLPGRARPARSRVLHPAGAGLRRAPRRSREGAADRRRRGRRRRGAPARCSAWSTRWPASSSSWA